MKSTLSGHKKYNRGLFRLLRKFAYCIKYCNDPKAKDVGYWYGERTLTALLGDAAWLLVDGWSLEEFTGQRSKGKGPKATPGRGDLWLEVGKKKFTVEAKVTWPEQLDDVAKWKWRVEAKLRLAFGQLARLSKSYRYGLPAAVCYVVPAIRKDTWNTTNSTLTRSIKQFLRDMTETDKLTVAIACWHEPNQMVPADGRKKDKTYYPGVVTVIRWQQRWQFHKHGTK